MYKEYINAVMAREIREGRDASARHKNNPRPLKSLGL
jgi:hypothetical protein